MFDSAFKKADANLNSRDYLIYAYCCYKCDFLMNIYFNFVQISYR